MTITTSRGTKNESPGHGSGDNYRSLCMSITCQSIDKLIKMKTMLKPEPSHRLSSVNHYYTSIVRSWKGQNSATINTWKTWMNINETNPNNDFHVFSQFSPRSRHGFHCRKLLFRITLTLILLTWRIWWAPNNASKWQKGFNSAFKGLNR